MEDSSRNSRPVKNWTYKWHQIEPSEQRLRHGHTHTHLYINNHSPSTQFIYILFVPFHLSTCRNNPVRVRNIIEVFFFLSSFHHRIFSNEVVCSNGTLEEKTGNKDISPYVGSKPRCCWSCCRRVGVFLSEFCCGAGHSIIESEQNTSSQRESVTRYRASGL